jgi:HK97 family phage portal protein
MNKRTETIKDESGTEIRMSVISKAAPQGVSRSVTASRKAGSQQTGLTDKGLIPQPIDLSQITQLYELDNDFRVCTDSVVSKVTSGGLNLVSKSDIKNPSSDQKKKLKDWLDKLPYDPDNPSSEFLTLLDVIGAAVADWSLTQNGYFELVRDGAGRPVGLYNVPSREMYRKSDFSGYAQKVGKESAEFVYFKNYGDKKAQEDPENKDQMTEIIHLMFNNPNSRYYGAPQQPLIKYALLDKLGIEYNIGMFERGGVPDHVVVVTGGNLSNKSLKRIEKFIDKEVRGPDNSNRILLLEGLDEGVNIKIQPLGVRNQDMQFSELHGLSRDEKVRGFRLPPSKAGVQSATSQSPSDSRSQDETFKYDVVKPMQSRIEKILNILAEQIGITDWEIKLDELDVRDERENADIAKTYASIPGIKLHEVRQLAGLPTDMDEELYFIPQGFNLMTEDEIKSLIEDRKKRIAAGENVSEVLGQGKPAPSPVQPGQEPGPSKGKGVGPQAKGPEGTAVHNPREEQMKNENAVDLLKGFLEDTKVSLSKIAEENYGFKVTVLEDEDV